MILLRGNNIILVTHRNAHSGFDVIGVNQDWNSDMKENWHLSVIKNSAVGMTSPEPPSGSSMPIDIGVLFSVHVDSVLRF